MKTPPCLGEGDLVAIVCTASAFRGKIEPAIRSLESWGLRVRVYPSASAVYHSFAGADAQRTEDLQHALNDPEIRAIFAARGGYGTVRIIDAIHFDDFVAHPKWIIGFSDVTVLHSHIQRQLETATIHGQMPSTFAGGTMQSMHSLRQALFGQWPDIAYSSPNPYNRTGNAKGILTGGNLAILHSLIGSDSDIVYADKILFLEDVGEPHYHIDRMLYTLKRAGKLDKLRGLIIGGFTALKDNDSSFGQSVPAIIMDKIRHLSFPVAFDFPAGHLSDNQALILGKNVHLRVEEKSVKLKYT